MNGADWSKRYPRIVKAAARIKVSAVMDAEVVCLDEKGVSNFDTLHSRTADHFAVACAFDLLMVNGDDLRRWPLRERKLALGKLLLRSRDGIQYVEHAEGHGERMYEAVCGARAGRDREQAIDFCLSVGAITSLAESQKS
jgi:bifunctional non-homologous end joining protein LigD